MPKAKRSQQTGKTVLEKRRAKQERRKQLATQRSRTYALNDPR
jgi:hypothetical protein